MSAAVLDSTLAALPQHECTDTIADLAQFGILQTPGLAAHA
jgi:hypothetical protein